jgi:hypothetical protein
MHMKLTILPAAALAIASASLAHAAPPSRTLDIVGGGSTHASSSDWDFARFGAGTGNLFVTGAEGSYLAGSLLSPELIADVSLAADPTEPPLATPSTVVPEPATMLLFAAGMLLAGAVRYRAVLD